ncbi:biotin-dependent carboxyltransferase family protein [Aneurinibacillus aneurinilyticus]|jgi:biotin-dependent carboxylase-like uncharacterized protein|uniref:Biotin-dependent carboxyltransferase n=2 Tax=Aneurinibacillus aneurinilyticus TaxID=1391 RepID=A0A848CX98_ANEAE|nr:biotin-dependent carboxyltransferase family protein [Aneurinibacillus aneurinilyticus]ERI09785.1 allophanate hydrolase subunit 2 [Aneurinibacillus aneurinilyticus ATCC 12856]MCI1694966.1 biotin-dependent carboxyltransferase family protein [Aneurinibacillus aneurinilyticus]MED0670301.1 biotin-dependent carboxyltransferase family protein [Aneurinibacillus aneurinilyticus]MED0707139.1 biotin-dependent carboxyltransferase family protein [Aneurinibacillus aneurinilyticus]MED0723473.1 biotin-depe
MLDVIKPGLHTTIQDLGRDGFYHLGVPPGGAADKYSFQIGNFLVGNPAHYAGLEIRMLGPTLLFTKRTLIAITGAPTPCFINDEPVPMWQCLEIKAGDVLSFRFAQQGICTYVCISGGIHSPEFLGSQSTYIVHQKPECGYKLEIGGKLSLNEPLPGAFKHAGRFLPESFRPSFSKTVELHATLGLAIHRISDQGVRVFLDNEWTVSTESDRIAYRLSGGPLSFEQTVQTTRAGDYSANVVDLPYPVGVITVPNPEELIILVSDATAGGGFVTIGAVISADLDTLSQCRPQTTVHFSAVTMEQALHLRMEKKQRLASAAEYLMP